MGTAKIISGLPHTQRIHTDDSILIKFYDNQNKGAGLSKFTPSRLRETWDASTVAV